MFEASLVPGSAREQLSIVDRRLVESQYALIEFRYEPTAATHALLSRELRALAAAIREAAERVATTPVEELCRQFFPPPIG